MVGLLLRMSLAVLGATESPATPVILHATDPTPPGKLCTLVGEGWNSSRPELRAGVVQASGQLAEAEMKPLEITQAFDRSVTAILPTSTWGVVAIQARNAAGWGQPYYINRARLDWLSADEAAPGQTVRALGRNLVGLELYPATDAQGRPCSYGGYVTGSTQVVLRAGDRQQSARVTRMSAYDVHFVVPESLPAGNYEVRVHNGHGGPLGWSDPLPLTVRAHQPWPSQVFNVVAFGARGDAQADDTAAIRQALEAAGRNKGGVVYFPPGGYLITQTLFVPPCTILKGQSRERSWLWLPDGVDHGTRHQAMAVKVGLVGAGPFGLEDLSVHGVYAHFLISSPLKAEVMADLARIAADPDLGQFLPDDAKDKDGKPRKEFWRWRGWDDMLDLQQRIGPVHIRRCRLFQEPTYRYHVRRGDPFLARERLDRESVWWSCAAVALCGDGIEIADCDIKGGGLPIMLRSCTRAIVARNQLHAGTSCNGLATMVGPYPQTPVCDRLVIEDNTIRPATNRNHSGFWFHASGSRYYVARNTIRLFWVCDVEGILFHGAGHQVVLQLAGAEGKTLRFAPTEAERWLQDLRQARHGGAWIDASTRRFKPGVLKGTELIVVQGKGLGQRRQVVDNTADSLTVDEPWRVEPDATSMAAVCTFPNFRQIVVVDNEVEDAGAGIMPWGNSYDFVADGNGLRRSGGVYAHQVAHVYREWSGNFFFQALHNVTSEGRFYGGPVRWTEGVSGVWYAAGKRGIGQLSTVFRENRFQTDTSLVFWPGRTAWAHGPTDVGTIAEDNRFQQCKVGIMIGEGVRATLRGNRFEEVERPCVIQGSGQGVWQHPADRAAVPLEAIERRWAAHWPEPARQAWADHLKELQALRTLRPEQAQESLGPLWQKALATVQSIADGRQRNAALAVMLSVDVGSGLEAVGPDSDRALVHLLAAEAAAGRWLGPAVRGPEGGPLWPDPSSAVGAWLAQASTAIVDVGPSPFQPLDFGQATVGKDRLYLIVTRWPGRPVRIPPLLNVIRSVWRLKDRRPVSWRRDDQGLHLDLSGEPPDPLAPVVVLELDGPPRRDNTLFQSPEGVLRLPADQADLQGEGLRLVPPGAIAYWSDVSQVATWRFAIVKPGRYHVAIVQSVDDAMHGSTYAIEIDDQPRFQAVVRPSGGWEQYITEALGEVDLAGGRHTLTVRPLRLLHPFLMNVQAILLKPATSSE